MTEKITLTRDSAGFYRTKHPVVVTGSGMKPTIVKVYSLGGPKSAWIVDNEDTERLFGSLHNARVWLNTRYEEVKGEEK